MKVLTILRKVTDAIVAVLFAVLVTLVLMQVLTRSLHMSQTWIDEISKFLFVWVTYLGGAITVRKGANVCFDLILEGCKGKSYKVLFTLVNIVAVIFMAAVCFLGTQQAWANRVQWSTMTRMNMGAMNAAIPIGFALMIIAQIEYYFTHVKAKENEEAETK